MKETRPELKNDLSTILVIDNSPAVTGAYNSIMSVTKTLRKQFTFYFALSSESLTNNLYKEGLKVKHIAFLEIQKNWKILLYFPMLLVNTYRLQKIIKKHDVRIIHVNDLYNMCGVLLKILNPRLTLIYHVRLLPSSYAKLLYNTWSKMIFKFSDQVICVSKAVFTALALSDKKTIIYDALPAITTNVDKKTKNNLFTFLYIGNFIPGKGQNFAIEAYNNNELNSSTQLIFVGGDMGKPKNKAYKQSLESLVKQKNLSNQVSFVGFKSNLDEYYQIADVVINFSESESFSMVCLESLMNGLPVIASKCGGPEEIIEHGVNGFLVKNRGVEEMTCAMVTIYQKNELRRAMSMQAKDVSNKFSLVSSAQKLAKTYTDLC